MKEAFYQLAKRYHPDSGSAEADSTRFTAVRDAYKTVMESGTVEGVGTPSVKQDGFDQDSEMSATMEELARKFDIRHTAPQHRQYLSFDGFGRGAPMQRQRQFDQHRVETAAAQAIDYKMEKLAWKNENTALVADKKKAKDIKTRYGLERVVEDMIQESMNKGEFDVIKNRGKPIKTGSDLNPYTDFMTTKMNEILINNGYQPEWVELGAEIRKEMEQFRSRLRHSRSKLGEYPFENVLDTSDWIVHVKKFENDWRDVNSKIWKYNLLVPTLNQQIVPIAPEKEVEKILSDGFQTFRKHSRSPDMKAEIDPSDKEKLRRYAAPNEKKVDSPMELFSQIINDLFRWK